MNKNVLLRGGGGGIDLLDLGITIDYSELDFNRLFADGPFRFWFYMFDNLELGHYIQMNLKQSNTTTGFAPFVASTILVDVSTPLDGFPSKLKDKVLYIIGEEPNSKFIAILGLVYPDTLAAVSRTVGSYTISIDTNLGQDNYIIITTDILEHWLLIQLNDGFFKQDGIESLTIYLKDIP